MYNSVTSAFCSVKLEAENLYNLKSNPFLLIKDCGDKQTVVLPKQIVVSFYPQTIKYNINTADFRIFLGNTDIYKFDMTSFFNEKMQNKCLLISSPKWPDFTNINDLYGQVFLKNIGKVDISAGNGFFIISTWYGAFS